MARSLIAVETNEYIVGVVYLFTSGEVVYVQAAKKVLSHGVREIRAIILSDGWIPSRFERNFKVPSSSGKTCEGNRACSMVPLIGPPVNDFPSAHFGHNIAHQDTAIPTPMAHASLFAARPCCSATCCNAVEHLVNSCSIWSQL